MEMLPLFHFWIETVGYGDWAHLPEDLLIDITKRLKSVEDMAAFSSVCSTWKAVSHTVKLKWAPSAPWVMLPKNTDDFLLCKWKVFNPSTKKHYNVGLPETLCQHYWGCIDGWICTLGLDFELRLFNPLTKAELPLPPTHTIQLPGGMNCSNPSAWFSRRFFTDVTIIKTPLKNELIVFATHNNYFLLFAKPGDSAWTALECYELLEYPDEGETMEICLENVVDFNGQILAFYENGKLQSLGKSDCFLTDQVGNFLTKDKVDSIAEVYVPGDVDGAVSFYGDSGVLSFNLVESFGDLLLVLRCSKHHDTRSDFITRQYEVFKFDSKAKDWVKLDDLGDVSLFVDDHSCIVVRASNVDNCKPNCIYFMEVDHWLSFNQYSLGIFNLQSQNVEMEEVNVGDGSLCRNFSPFWFLPKPE